MRIEIKQRKGNVTAEVVSALARIGEAGGGELHFEKGEYHFYREGCVSRFFAVSNNSAGEKAIVFPIIDMENVTVDGHGSLFVFHEVTFPFLLSHSQNITLKNITFDLGTSPLVTFRLHDFSDDGFYMDIDREESPFVLDDGAIDFIREWGVCHGKDKLFSLHAMGRHQVQYLATGEKDADPSTLPAPLMKCNLTPTPTGVYAKYREDSPRHCTFGEETVSCILDGGRSVDAICLDHSCNIRIKNIAIARAIGMGIVGQLSTNIYINGFSTDTSLHPGHQTMTADAMHFVNCDGVLEITNCQICDTMDDALNVHGMYTVVSGVEGDTLFVKIMHREQKLFSPYREGDRLVLIDNVTLEKKAEFRVTSSQFVGQSGFNLALRGAFLYGKEEIENGYLVENPDRMPDLYMHHNHFHHFPHNRISGAGKVIVEDNIFSDCHAALLCLDLARFWYESGRVRHLVYRNNTLKNCDITGRGAFVRIGVDGYSPDATPRIHEKIEITGNHFSEIPHLAILVSGVKEWTVEHNTFDREDDDLVQIY